MTELIIPIEKINLIDNSVPCVYTLYSGDNAIYVGQTVDLLTRLNTHSKDKDFDSFSFFKADICDLDNIEAKQIVSVNPSQNKCLPSNDLFVSDKLAIKSLSEEILNKLRVNAVFTGCRRSEKTGSLNYVSNECYQELFKLISKFDFTKGEE